MSKYDYIKIIYKLILKELLLKDSDVEHSTVINNKEYHIYNIYTKNKKYIILSDKYEKIYNRQQKINVLINDN